MTEPTGAVFDLGYQPYGGERLGRRGAALAVYRDGLRRVLGLRRKARRKALPLVLIIISAAPALFFVAFSVITGGLLSDQADFFGAAELFSFNATVALLFVALAASELLVPDRTYGTLAVYSSRPLSAQDYLAARTAALATLVAGMLLLPMLLVVIGNAFVSDDGFLSSLVGDLDLLARGFGAAVLYFAAFAPLALLVAAYAARTSYAAAIYLAVVFVANAVSEALVNIGLDVAGLFALNHHPRYAGDWIFGDSTLAWIPERAGFEPVVSLAVIVTLAVGSIAVVIRRYRRML